jgi:hypothetical protein
LRSETIKVEQNDLTAARECYLAGIAVMLDFAGRVQLEGRATVSKLEAWVRFPPSAPIPVKLIAFL